MSLHISNVWKGCDAYLNDRIYIYFLINFVILFVSVGNTIHFRFDVGNGIQTLEQITAYPMNDNQWHTCHVERNRKQSTLKVRATI